MNNLIKKMEIKDKEILINNIALFILENETTVRYAADYFGISKSTVHKYMQKELESQNYELYILVRDVLNKNLEMRHINGGKANKERLLKKNEGKKISLVKPSELFEQNSSNSKNNNI